MDALLSIAVGLLLAICLGIGLILRQLREITHALESRRNDVIR